LAVGNCAGTWVFVVCLWIGVAGFPAFGSVSGV
jgi:hypothetical protein